MNTRLLAVGGTVTKRMAAVPFDYWWRDTEYTPMAEYRFHPERRWRFDFAFPAQRLAVEFDGGQWVIAGGRHNRDGDREKLNTAAAMGWRVLRFSNQQWERDPYGCVAQVLRALEWGR